MVKKGKKKITLADKIEARRQQYASQKLKQAITCFFASCDEDGNGFMEPHEFVIAQTVLAEIAGECFDDEAATGMFENVRLKAFDAGGTCVTKMEFEKEMLELCAVIPRSADTIVTAMAEKAALVVAQMRREVLLEIRKFFKVLDEDRSGYLDKQEMETLANIAQDLAEQAQKDLGSGEFLTIESFDNSHDGLVELTEFVDHLLDFTKRVKVPKRDIIHRLRELTELRALHAG
mmetsp:Transcript_82457/g.191558  ORF Transcript_82457/g.191558 Transcript_82457/m.191558 type:complete len:233 (+) Transcript_82457:195-893(+)|eukprot:CAMPEP_0171145748 /NCGR_PEP_ID=MMETSP0766_2-20121228/147221_1 /TAXON_ID=439317 /ORGANISM="Gambierdiscus australes, Strain CAWD 149" /LENGTH=232 /DNA_ID=CAMNT_0011609655 /DNA_START=206 /DNA_END=904 /DNA_ORIENTATION=-